jgi:hypothetical protein
MLTLVVVVTGSVVGVDGVVLVEGAKVVVDRAGSEVEVDVGVVSVVDVAGVPFTAESTIVAPTAVTLPTARAIVHFATTEICCTRAMPKGRRFDA